jgi:hypothetical protein
MERELPKENGTRISADDADTATAVVQLLRHSGRRSQGAAIQKSKMAV